MASDRGGAGTMGSSSRVLSRCGAGDQDTSGRDGRPGSARRDQPAGISAASTASPHVGDLDEIEPAECGTPIGRPSAPPHGGSRGAPPRRAGVRAVGPTGPRRRGRARRSRRCRGVTAAPRCAPATASASARSSPRSVTRRPPATLAYTSAPANATLRVLLEHREQHGEAPRLHPRRRPPRHRRAGAHDQRLHLDEHRARAFEHRRHRRAGHAGTAVDEEPRRRVGHVDEAALGHLEQPELVGARRTGASARGAVRSEWPRSPSNESTVSTTCSSTRGPATRALLGDVADEHRRERRAPSPAAPAGTRSRAPA